MSEPTVSKRTKDLLNAMASRRRFLRDAAATALASGALASCKNGRAAAQPATQSATNGVAQKGAATGGTMGAHDTSTGAPPALSAAAAMDTMHGTVPAPQIRVREGDRVRINLKNELPESTAIHLHGLGLLGAFIVEPKSPRPIEKVDRDYIFILNDGAHGYTFNGKSFPATEPLIAKLAETIRIRYMNEGMMIHPMHLHGMHMTVIDKDGWPQPAPWKCDTLNIAPGERWDVIVKCTNPGTWAFHCHILPHAESDHGMFGMVTALVVQK